jgi:hypothetical protein
MRGNSSAQLRVGSSAAMRVVSRGILRMRKGGTPLRRLDAALTRFSFFTNVSVRFRSLQFHLDSNEPLPALRTESQSAGRGFLSLKNPSETWIARLKRNCEHFSACIDN